MQSLASSGVEVCTFSPDAHGGPEKSLPWEPRSWKEGGRIAGRRAAAPGSGACPASASGLLTPNGSVAPSWSERSGRGSGFWIGGCAVDALRRVVLDLFRSPPLRQQRRSCRSTGGVDQAPCRYVRKKDQSADSSGLNSANDGVPLAVCGVDGDPRAGHPLLQAWCPLQPIHHGVDARLGFSAGAGRSRTVHSSHHSISAQSERESSRPESDDQRVRRGVLWRRDSGVHRRPHHGEDQLTVFDLHGR